MIVKRYFGLTVMALLVSVAGSQTFAADLFVEKRVSARDFIAPNTIADIAERSSPAVVNIIAITDLSREQLTRLRSSEKSRDEGTKRVKKYFDMDSADDLENQVKVTGSGVIVRADGCILTSLHVVQNAAQIKVSLRDGRSFSAKLLGKDNFTDLALIKIEAQGLPEAHFANPDQLRLGEWVVAIGNQFGLEHTVTCGLISGLHREAKAFMPSFGARTGAVKFIQTDTPINPGSSGGPLLNLQGEVVGINSFIREDAQNIGFAIPATTAKEVANKLMRQDTISHPYIGIEMQDPSEWIQAKDKKSISGVEVTKVKSASPASIAGLEAGDLITEVDNVEVHNSTEVSQAIARHAVGDAVTVKVLRHGINQNLVVKVETLPDDL